MRLLSLPVTTLVLVACAGSPGPVTPHTTLTTSPYEGAGWAVALPPGATVAMTGETLGVDLPGGRRWFDVWWAPTPAAASLVAWARTTCTGLIWDRPANPSASVRTQTGFCTREGQEHWVMVAMEEHDGGTLITAYIANRDTQLEDAWVEFVGTALSLAPGPTPLQAIDEVTVRRALRQAAGEAGVVIPRAGGGDLGALMSERLGPLWEARENLVVPRPLTLVATPNP